MENRNIKLGYWLVALNNSFFWYAPWLLFLYQFIDIKQATLLQLIGMATRIVSEIPTGVICDLLGKRRTLAIAFFLTALGETIMAFSTNFVGFAVVYVIISLGYSFYSGTMDAFMYDSLVEAKEQERYPNVLGKSNAYMNAATAVATLSGGFLFQFWGGLPFLLTGMAKFAGLFLTLFITEPKVDTYVFSIKNFVKMTGKGFAQMFGSRMIKYTVLLFVLGAFSTIAFEILDDAAVVDWGYSAVGISLLYTGVIVLSIPSGLLYEKIAKKINAQTMIILAILFLALNYVLSLWINAFIWSTLFLLRVLYSPIKDAVIADVINQHTSSNIRATTLSTYELIIKLPFVLLGVPIGLLLKDFGVKAFSVTFSMILLVTLAVVLILNRINNALTSNRVKGDEVHVFRI